MQAVRFDSFPSPPDSPVALEPSATNGNIRHEKAVSYKKVLESLGGTGLGEDMTTTSMVFLTAPVTNGFWGPATPFYAEITLALEGLMGFGLLLGAVLARLRRYQAHAWCQSSIVLLNMILLALIMIPSFHSHVVPKLPAKLGKSFYAVPTIHGAFGAITEITGLYVLLAAGTKFLPQPLRLVNYKLWMRTVLALWWLVILLGVWTYARWYRPELFRK
jgi:uncharacterized membrane protein YozB (DUF420 family)